MSSERSGVILRPWLWLPSQMAHDLAPYMLPLLSPFIKLKNPEYRPFQWKGLSFQNPLGIAGGVDKSGQSLEAWATLGAGFLEVGTVTPEPQGPNPGKIMDRNIDEASLWNKMGFPNPGAQALVERLKKIKSLDRPLFINIGKNRWTENDKAHEDYGSCIRQLHPFADAFVVNLSSPNTKGLRDLLSEKELVSFLEKVKSQAQAVGKQVPILLKLSPDMDESTLRMALSNSSPLVDGWILTNTTKARHRDSSFPLDAGGVSGAPLKQLSRQALRVAAEYKKDNPAKLLISVGGIDSAEEIRFRLEAGADLLQVYSALVFQGPTFFKKVLVQLKSSSQ